MNQKIPDEKSAEICNREKVSKMMCLVLHKQDKGVAKLTFFTPVLHHPAVPAEGLFMPKNEVSALFCTCYIIVQRLCDKSHNVQKSATNGTLAVFESSHNVQKMQPHATLAKSGFLCYRVRYAEILHNRIWQKCCFENRDFCVLHFAIFEK